METPDEMRAKVASKAATDADFRALLVSDPKAAIARELSITIPDSLTIEVHSAFECSVNRPGFPGG